ncbi:MAG TPA: GMC family oxidoreductase [Granulicella sp.]
MQIDLEHLPSAPAEPYRSQVCIVGAGIAGLVLATSLARSGVEVHLLEAGGLAPEDRSQQLYEVRAHAERHSGATEGRFRTFGGSSTRWGGQLLPYTADIFAPPAGVASLPWPVDPSELAPFYPQIEDLLGADHLPFTADLYSRFHRNIPATLTGSPDLLLRASKWAPFSRRNLASTLGEQAIASNRITVFLHANVTELLLAADGSRIEAVLARDYRGNQLRFEAQRYIVATGTIESSRLLLASRSVAPEGVGNAHDQVGRGFHDHISYPAAILTGAARSQMLAWFAPILSQGTTHTAKLEAAPVLRQRLGLLAMMAHITIEEPEDSGAGVLRGLLRSMQRGDLRSALVQSLPRLPGASLEIGRLAVEARLRHRRAVSPRAAVTLRIDSEQLAGSGNRIRLAPDEQDALGQPRALLDWQVAPGERRSIRAFAAFLREFLPAVGLGFIDWPPELQHEPEAPLTGITDTYHMMGGTLMGTDPATSVVDASLRVHGVENLFIASCSTFPSGGSSNPTFTMIALSLRLAEKLARDS